MNEIQTRIRQTALKVVEVADKIVDQVLNPPTPPALPLTDTRRQIANILRVSQLCANAKCRRSGSCRGEPADCLRVIVPLMPDAMIGLLKMRRKRR